MANILTISNICKSFKQGEQELKVLNDISMTIESGESVALLGESGSGKSTLLQIIGLLDTPTSGEITINNKECGKLNDKARTKIRRDELGFIYQFHHLLPEFSALENVAMPLIIKGESKNDAFSKASEMLNMMKMAPRETHFPSELSGGEQQRVAIARSLIHRPNLILADEPTGNLDPETADQVFNIMSNLVKELNIAAFIVTHNHSLAGKMDRIVTLKENALV